VISFFVIVEP